MKGGIADELREVGGHARRLKEVGSAEVVPLGGNHQVKQAGE